MSHPALRDTSATSGPCIYVLLPVHSRRLLTEQFVRCLLAQTYTTFHLVLIDDGSTDNTASAVCEVLPGTTVLRGQGDWWWGGSLDQGISWLTGNQIDDLDLVLFINDDVTMEADYFARAVQIMQTRVGSFVLSQRLSLDGVPEETGKHVDLDRLHFSDPSTVDEINCLSTQGLFAHWKDVRAVGRFRPTLLPHYLSDYEYTIRAHKLGIRCATSPDLLIELNRETTGYHRVNEQRFGTFLKKFFSRKAPGNPFYFTVFAWLVCPRTHVVPIVFRIWRDALRTIARALLDSLRATSASARP